MRAMQGSAYGKAMNTKPEGPATTALSQASTSAPQPQGTPVQNVHETAAPRSGQAKSLIPTKKPMDYKQYIRHGPGEGAEDQSGLAAKMGRASLAKAKKKNLDQQNALSQRAMK